MSTLSVPAVRPAWHAPLIEFLPLVRSVAADAFRSLGPAERDDAVCDVVADSAVEFARLAAQGRAHFWFISAVARYAVRRRAAGRRPGTATNKNDALSPVPRAEGCVVSLDALEGDAPDVWRAAVADSRRTDPAEAAAFRVDFAEWLGSLSDRQRRLVAAFSAGDKPGEVACRLRVTPGRVSQLRTELHASWVAFQGGDEPIPPKVPDAA